MHLEAHHRQRKHTGEELLRCSDTPQQHVHGEEQRRMHIADGISKPMHHGRAPPRDDTQSLLILSVLRHISPGSAGRW